MMLTIIIKLAAISWLALFHVFISLIISRAIDYIMPPVIINQDTGKEDKIRSLSLITVNITLLAIAAYLIRNIGERIPFPLDGIAGYNHSRLKERSSLIISGFLLMYYQTKLRKRFDNVMF